jgi:hypothetical protein
MINAEVLKALGPEGYLINVARGSVVDEAALVDALQQGVIAGAALDVFEKEPHPTEALWSMDNVVLTPHMASGTGADAPCHGQPGGRQPARAFCRASPLYPGAGMALNQGAGCFGFSIERPGFNHHMITMRKERRPEFFASSTTHPQRRQSNETQDNSGRRDGRGRPHRGGQAAAQEKLTVWWVKGFYKAEDDALFAAIKKYEEKHKGVKIELSQYPVQDMIPKTVAALDSGKPARRGLCRRL